MARGREVWRLTPVFLQQPQHQCLRTEASRRGETSPRLVPRPAQGSPTAPTLLSPTSPPDLHPTACPGLPPPQHCPLLPSSSPAADAPEESLYCKGKGGTVLGAWVLGAWDRVAVVLGLGGASLSLTLGGGGSCHQAALDICCGRCEGVWAGAGPPCPVPTRCRHARRTARAWQSAGPSGETPVSSLTHRGPRTLTPRPGGHPPGAPAPGLPRPTSGLPRPAC